MNKYLSLIEKPVSSVRFLIVIFFFFFFNRKVAQNFYTFQKVLEITGYIKHSLHFSKVCYFYYLNIV